MTKGNVVVGLCQQTKVLATATIPLISIIKGPIHQSFSLIDRKKLTIAKITFNAELNQITELTLMPQNVRFVLDEPREALFSMNFKIYTDKMIESERSHVSNSLNFIFDEEDFGESKIPVLKFDTSIESIRTTSLQVRLWRHKENQLNNSSLIGECWIGIAKLFKEDKQNIYHMESSLFTSKQELTSHMTDIPDQTTANHSKFFSEVLWYNGKRVGNVSGTLDLRGLPVVYQMVSGVNTENGYQIQDSLLNPRNSRYMQSELPKEIMDIVSLTDKLKVFIRNGRHSVKSDSKDYKEHVKLIEQIIKNLERTHRESMKCFIYKDSTDLTRAQRALLDLGDLLINYAEFIQYDVKPFYFDCLTKLNDRGELGLGHLSFLNEEPGMHSKRLDIAERYAHFLQVTLNFALDTMNFKGVEQKMQKFIESFLAIAYFRIPDFRAEILECIKSKSYYPIAEWRGITMDLEEDISEHNLLPALDWTSLFYDYLKSEDFKNHLEILQDEKWKKRIAKRGLVFFRFVEEWAMHISQELVRESLPWNHVPGYNVILKGFLIEMKERHISDYPEAMIETSKSLLRNTQLLNVFVYILFRKTNINNFKNVFESFNLLSTWFDTVYRRNKSMPKNFDHNFLLKGLKIALKSQICLCIAKALWLIYMHFHMIRGSSRVRLVKDFLLEKHSNRLFFHWSKDVRRTFMSLLYYRILSMKHVYFETDTIDQRDENLMAETDHFLQLALESARSQVNPKNKLFLKDHHFVRESYNKWLKSISSKLDQSQENLYGPYARFPYPVFNIVNQYQDLSEKRIEEW